jgi:methyltransferase (TIGR00027 family)
MHWHPGTRASRRGPIFQAIAHCRVAELISPPFSLWFRIFRMNEHRSSFTASAVAFARGLGIKELPGDPWAEGLVEPAFARLLKLSSNREWLRLGLSRSSCGLATHMAMRSAMIDRALEAAVAAGVDQIVILGAGLDTRSLRLGALAGCRIYEVDHPSTQEAKCLALERVPGNLVFVPVDFESDALTERLAQAGLDSTRPSAWVMEGVTMYLSRSAIEQTLRDVSWLSATGSRLLVSYAHKDYIPMGETVATLSRDVFKFSGEHLQSWFSGGEFAELLEEAGFTVHADQFDQDWARQLGVGRFFSGLFKVEHLVDARMAS